MIATIGYYIGLERNQHLTIIYYKNVESFVMKYSSIFDEVIFFFLALCDLIYVVPECNIPALYSCDYQHFVGSYLG